MNTENKEDMIHHFKPLYQAEEVAKPTEVGTFYQFLLDEVEVIDMPLKVCKSFVH